MGPHLGLRFHNVMVVVCGPCVTFNTKDMHKLIHHHCSKGNLQMWNCGSVHV